MTNSPSRSWLITGSSSGLGRELAKVALDSGHRVVLAARNVASLEAVAREYPDRAVARALDLRDPESIAGVVAEAERAFGGVDVLVNNAGVGYLSSIEAGDDRAIRELFDTNVHGLAATIRAALPGMRERKRGTIANVSSIGGFLSFPVLGYYAATKFAVEGLTEALWQEIEPLGLRALLLEPGGLRTGIVSRSARSKPIDVYAATAGAALASIDATADQLPGDPVAAAKVIFELLTREGPLPHRVLLGSDAYDGVLAKLEALKRELEPQEAIARSIDFDKRIQ